MCSVGANCGSFAALSHIMSSNKSGTVILLGDFNAETGKTRTGWERELGNFGHGTINGNGLRLLSFAATHRLGIVNTWFRHKTRVTWHSNDGVTTKTLDYILIPRRFGSSVTDSKVLPASSIGSDHEMVIAKLSLKLKVRKKKSAHRQLDWEALKSDATLLERY